MNENKNDLVAYSLFPFGDTLHALFKTDQQWNKRKTHKSNARSNVYWPCGVETNSSTKYNTHSNQSDHHTNTNCIWIWVFFSSLFTKSTANNSYFTQTLDCQAFDSVARLYDCRQNGNKSRSQWKLRMCSQRKWSNFLWFFCVVSIRQKRFVHLKITMCKESWHRATNGMPCLCVCVLLRCEEFATQNPTMLCNEIDRGGRSTFIFYRITLKFPKWSATFAIAMKCQTKKIVRQNIARTRSIYS